MTGAHILTWILLAFDKAADKLARAFDDIMPSSDCLQSTETYSTNCTGFRMDLTSH